jgi:hypothetical protein
MGADKRLRVAREEAELQRRVDIAEVEERKNTHIQVHKHREDHGIHMKAIYVFLWCFQASLRWCLMLQAELEKRQCNAVRSQGRQAGHSIPASLVLHMCLGLQTPWRGTFNDAQYMLTPCHSLPAGPDQAARFGICRNEGLL